MRVNNQKNINLILGSRFVNVNPFESIWNFGNYIFTFIFNLFFNTKLHDALSCSKSLYKDSLKIDLIKSKRF